MNLPGAACLSVRFQAASSRQTSRIRVLVATEMPGDPTAVALGDTETRSATMVSKPTGVMVRSQAEIRSIRKGRLT